MKLRSGWCRITLSLLFVLTLALPIPVRADGGPIIIGDPQLWASLEEGKQIAVVRLGETEDTVQVDLFVSLLDTSGESHEITFFIPLGNDPTAFDVVEENSHDFEAAQTEALDDRLADAAKRERNYQSKVRSALGPGTFLTGGGITGFGTFSALMLLGPSMVGETFDQIVAAVPAPVATFQTEHSLVELYDIDADTDLEALAATTGLAPAVQETLRRLEGQQIAIITMQTQPVGAEEGKPSGHPSTSRQQGLRLAWTTRLVPGDEGGTYAYPLGTGSAWARPIEFTRVYVFAPAGVHFRVSYPRLGVRRSGYDYTRGFYGRHFEPLIMQHTNTPGYAVDQAVGDFGRIWRATYVQSNAAEDIVVTRVEGWLPEIRAALHPLVVRQLVVRYTWVVGLLAALAIWVIAYRFVMSRKLGFTYHWLDSQLWGHAVGWILVYVGSNLLSLLMAWIPVLGCVEPLLSLLTSLGVVSGFLFTHVAEHRWGIPREKAVRAYALVVIASNVGYGLFALAYLALVGALV